MENLIIKLKNDFTIDEQEIKLLDFLQEKNLVINQETLEKIELFTKYKLDFKTVFAYLCYQYEFKNAERKG